MVKYYIERMKERVPKSWLLLREVLRYWRRLCLYNASFSTDNDIQKMQYTLLRENHVIEKGMSMKNPKRGFGREKVARLIKRLSLYYVRYGKQDLAFLFYPLSTISEYLDYMKEDGVDVSVIESSFNCLCEKAGVRNKEFSRAAGIFVANRESIQNAAKGDFHSLLHSRHSIRYFEDKLPDVELIEKALHLAARTPSACNRQAWHTHIYMGEKCHELLEMQGGCNGFCHDIHCSIVVTADMKGFLDYEPFQCYVDGGLYAMNLINALHFMGLGTIPLSCGFYYDKLSAMQERFLIPSNEVMVVIIGIGVLSDQMKIAESGRKPIEVTNTFH